MNGIHDMGGMTTFGPVPREESGAFHAEWEKRLAAVATSTVSHRLFPGDEFRHVLERLDPAVYLSTTYYERWLAGLERLLVEKGFISEDEMAAALEGWRPQPGVNPVRVTADETQSGADEVRPRFAAADRVLVSNAHVPGHTRMPRYVRGRRGIVDRFLGVQVLPDDLVSGRGIRRRPVYAVRFEACELWGDDASPHDTVMIDLWEDYLLPDGDTGEEETK